MPGQLSPDGRHEWTGEEWREIPPPPKSRMDVAHGYFQVLLVFVLVIVVMAIIAAALA